MLSSFADLRSMVGVSIKLRPNLCVLFDLLFESFEELVVDGVLNIETRRRGANLATVTWVTWSVPVQQVDVSKLRGRTHNTHVRPLYSLVEIAVVEYQKRTLAAGLQSNVLQVIGGSSHDTPASNGA